MNPAPDFDLPDLPSVPQDNLPGVGASGGAKNDEDDIDFDELI